MKRNILVGILLILCLFCLTACGGPTWQEKYDLGMRYLDEGNYEEAIIAFNAAIEIDPKQEDVYLALKDVYIAQGDTEKAIEILEQAIAAIGETDTLCEVKDLLEQSVLEEKQATVQELIAEYEPKVEAVPEVKQETEPHTEIKEEVLPLPLPESEPEPEHPEELIEVETDTSLNTEANEETNVPVQEQMRTEQTDNSDGTYYIKTYNSNNEMVAWSYYSANGEVIIDYTAKSGNHLVCNVNAAGNFISVHEYDRDNNKILDNRYGLDGSLIWIYEHEYASLGRVKRWVYYGSNGEKIIDYTAKNGNYLSFNVYEAGNFIWVHEYDSDDNKVLDNRYGLDGSLIRIYEYVYDSARRVTRWVYYGSNGEKIIDYTAKSGNHLSYNVYEAGNYIWVYEYDHAENMLRNNRYGLDGSPMWVYEYEYDSSGNVTRWIYYGRTGETILDYQAEEGCYLTHGQNANYIWVREYKSDGTELRVVTYTLDGALIGEN